MPQPDASVAYWGSPAGYPVASAPPSGRAEVCVIGAGVAGVATAVWLKRAGVQAVVLEAGHLARGASGRNAGFLLAGVAENYHRAVERYGRETAHAIWDFTLHNHRLVAELAAGADCHHQQRGSMTLAASTEERESLEASATLLHEDGLPGRWYPSVEAPGVAPGTAGLGCDADGCIHPVRFCAALARQAGVPLHEGCEVLSLQLGDTEVRLQLSTGAELTAEHVVLATNAHSRSLAQDIDVKPVRAQMLAARLQAPVPPAPPVYTEWGFRYWNLPTSQHLIYGGCRDRDEMAEYTASTAASDSLQRHLDSELTALGLPFSEITHRWAGTMGFTPDGLPLVGRHALHPRLWMAVGYNGHGMGFAVNCSRHLVGALTADSAIPAWLSASRLNGAPAGAP